MLKLIIFLLFPLVSLASEQATGEQTTAKEFISDLNEKDQTSVLSAENKNQILIKKVQDYLNGMTTLVAKFIQIDPQGDSNTGTLFISRPGKLRCQYDPPSPIVILINGNSLTQYDYELNEAKRGSSEDYPIALMVKRNIDLHKDVIIKKIEQASGNIKLSITKKGKEQEGYLTLIFGERPLLLKKIEMVDSASQVLSITFNNLQQGVKIDDKLFIAKEIDTLIR
jgi:outer membrane lipoprotein-sorting protein